MQQSDMTPKVEFRLRVLMSLLNHSISAESLSDLWSKVSGCDVFCALEGDEVIGTATLIRYTVLSGSKAWIEDVVVDQKYRRKGVAKALTQALIDRAKEMGADHLMLYTGVHRKEAHLLYEACGFTLKNSHLYQMTL